MTIFIVVLMSYHQSLHNPLLYDDPILLKNPDVTSADGSSMIELWTHDFWGQSLWHAKSHKSHRPICILTLRIVHTLCQGSDTAYHVLNILLHITASCLVNALSERIVSSPTRSFLAAVCFACHPVHVDAVEQVAGTAELLCANFMLAAFISCCRLRPSSSLRNKTACGLAAGTFCVLAMLSKEQGIMAVPLILLFTFSELFVRTRSFAVVGCALETLRTQFVVFFIGIGLASTKLALLSGTPPEYGRLQNPASHSDSVWTRIMSNHQAVAQHAGLLLLPHSLAVDYSLGSVPLVTTVWDVRNVLPFLLYVVLFGLAWAAFAPSKDAHTTAFVRVALLWLVIPFVPSSNLLFPVGFILAERVLYTPSVGFCMGLAHLITSFVDRANGSVRQKRSLAAVISAAVVAAYVARTVDHVHNFESEEALYKSGTEAQPNSPNMFYYLGNVYFHGRVTTTNNTEYALRFFEKSVDLLPTHAESLTHLGIIYHRAGQLEKAETYLSDALASEPHFLHRRENLAVVLLESKPPRICEALALFEDAGDAIVDAPYSMDEDGVVIQESKESDVILYIRKAMKHHEIVCPPPTSPPQY